MLNDTRSRRRQRNGPGGGERRAAAGGRAATASVGGPRPARRLSVVVGALLVDDLRDPHGVLRPMLRRVAVELSGREAGPARRLGAAYLRLDPSSAQPGGDTGRGAVTADDDVIEGEAVEVWDEG